MSHKTVVLTALLFLFMGQLTDCAYQSVCSGGVIKDRVVLESGDYYEACEDCTCTLIATSLDGTVIQSETAMTYIDAGYYGYTVETPPFYPNNPYTAYMSCSDGGGEVGSACIEFNVRECYADEAAAVGSSVDIPVLGPIDFSGLIQPLRDIADFLNPVNLLQEQTKLPVIGPVYSLVLTGIGVVTGVFKFIFFLGGEYMKFFNNPVDYSLDIYEYVKEVLWWIIYANFVILAVVELSLFVHVANKRGSLIMNMLYANWKLFKEILNVGSTLYTAFNSTVSTLASWVSAVGNWIPGT